MMDYRDPFTFAPFGVPMSPFAPPIAPQGTAQHQQQLAMLAQQLNSALGSGNAQLMMQALSMLSQLTQEDLLLVLGLMRPEIMQMLMEAMSQTPFSADGSVGNMGNSGSGMGATGAPRACNPPASTGGRTTPSTAGVSGTPNVAGAQNLTAEQKANARIIIEEGRKLGASDRDIQIALMTAMQESSLRNLTGGDRDSAGLFQQRPSCGWGTYAQVTDPRYAAQKFYRTLMGIGNRDSMSLTQAAQAVQRSAFPDAYAKWQDLAAGLMAELA
jgi:hypothetical protein